MYFISSIVLLLNLYTIQIGARFNDGNNTKIFERQIINEGPNGFQILNQNGIVNVINGIATVLNSTGIFTINANELKRVKKQISIENSIDYNGNSSIVTIKNGIKTVVNPTGIYISDIKTNTLIKSITPGQILTAFGGFIKVTNSSGVFIGDTTLSLKKLQSQPDDEFDGDQTVNYINGLIVLTNSTGVYIGKTYDTIKKLE